MSFRRLNPRKFNNITKRLHNYYKSGGLEWCYTSNVVNPLSACEDHRNIVKMTLGGRTEAVAQTQQMELERILMENSEIARIVDVLNNNRLDEPSINALQQFAEWGNPLALDAVSKIKMSTPLKKVNLPQGYFTEGNSFRDERIIGDWRHSRSFLMSEFELFASSQESAEAELTLFNIKLLHNLGFKDVKVMNYSDICNKYKVSKIGDNEETAVVLTNNCNPVIITRFTPISDPYWNMHKLPNGTFAKQDLILAAYNPVLRKTVGLECGGTAVRSCDIKHMHDMFYKQDNGNYARTMNEYFGTGRIQCELEKFFKNTFIPRFGGGIGVERLLAAMEYKDLL